MVPLKIIEISLSRKRQPHVPRRLKICSEMRITGSHRRQSGSWGWLCRQLGGSQHSSGPSPAECTKSRVTHPKLRQFYGPFSTSEFFTMTSTVLQLPEAQNIANLPSDTQLLNSFHLLITWAMLGLSRETELTGDS